MSSIIKAHTLGVKDVDAVQEADSSPVQPELPLEAAPSQPAVCLPRSPRRGAVEALRTARQQAAALLAAAQEEAQQLKERAQAEGYAEGLQAGRAQGMREGTEAGIAVGWGTGVEKAQAAVRSAQEMLAAAEEERAKALADMESQIITLALTIAQKIVQREIKRDEAYLTRLIKAALLQMGTTKQVTARVKPANAAQLAHTEGLMQESLGKLQVVVDDSLAVGDCVVESESDLLDGCLSTRFGAIHQALEKVAEA